jgi:hypothetical protein
MSDSISLLGKVVSLYLLTGLLQTEDLLSLGLVKKDRIFILDLGERKLFKGLKLNIS